MTAKLGFKDKSSLVPPPIQRKMASQNLHILMPDYGMGAATFRSLANLDTTESDRSILDFTAMANREWDSWTQRQGTIERKPSELDRNLIVASSSYEPEHWSSNPEGPREDVICPSSCSSPCVLFDKSPFELDDSFFPLDDQPVPFNDRSFELDDASSPLDGPVFPLDDLFLQSSPSPKLESTMQVFPEVAESRGGQPSIANARSLSYPGPATRNSLLAPTPAPLPAPSDISPYRKRKIKQRKSS
jgi:hypothetical protein